MAFHRFIRALLAGREISVYGDGKQTRDFTYVSDAVAGTYSAATASADGEVINVGGGARVPLLEIVRLLGEAAGREPRPRFSGKEPGDVRDTGADISKARRLLRYSPSTPLGEGLRRQLEHSAASRLVV
jgi:nucleoside-diphosphate-sugar epimerase